MALAQLLISFLDILRNEKNTIDTTYEDIQDRIFKLKVQKKNFYKLFVDLKLIQKLILP